MKRLVFVKRMGDVPAGGVYLGGGLPHAERYDLVEQFRCGLLDTLYAPAAMVTGWKTGLTADQCEVVFVGDNWGAEELAQGRNRVHPK